MSDLYLRGLQFAGSRRALGEALLRAARLLGYASAAAVPWHRLGLRQLTPLPGRLAERYAPYTAQLSLTAIRGVYRTGILLRRVTPEQQAIVRSLRIRGSRVVAGRALVDREIRALYRAARATPRPRGPLVLALLDLLLGTGMRRAEPCALRLAAVSARGLRVVGKGNKERLAPLDATTRAGVDRWLAERGRLRPSHPFLLSFRNRPLEPDSVGALLRSLAKRAGVAHFGVHDLRRTFASRLLDRGFDLREAQILLGHAGIDSTARYDRRTTDAVARKRVAARLYAR